MERGSHLSVAIVAVVGRAREHTETVRFAPRGDPEQWEIGEPYTPVCATPDAFGSKTSGRSSLDRTAGTWSDE